MMVYLAICHSNAYYDDYTEERIIGIYKNRDDAVESIFSDMVVFNSERASIENLAARARNLDNCDMEGLYEIIEMELK